MFPTQYSNLNVFSFYHDPEVVYIIADNKPYENEDGKYILSDSETGLTLIEDGETYLSDIVEGDFFRIEGTDSVTPFSGGGSGNLPNPLEVTMTQAISQSINYPFGTGSMTANSSISIDASVFSEMGYTTLTYGTKSYNFSDTVSISLGSCATGKYDGLVGSTSNSRTLKFTLSY